MIGILWNLIFLLGCVFALPFVEDVFRRSFVAGYENSKFGGLPHLYGVTLICCVVLPSFVLLYIGFAVTGKGRKLYGYKNPVHYASVDIHVEDVLSGGNVMSNGNVEAARKKLDDAVKYSNHQRTHGNTLEWFSPFVMCALLGGVVYPISASFWGVVWSVSRVVWTKGYSTGNNPIDRYSNPLGMSHWFAFLGCIALTIGAASNLLGSA